MAFRKDELYRCWDMQEKLLQTYRGFAISIQALLLTFTAALTKFLYDDIKSAGPIHLADWDTVVHLLLWLIIIVLVGLAGYSAVKFTGIINHRAHLVTMYQNLIWLDEQGVLEGIFTRLGIEKNPPIYLACQFADVTDRTRLTSEFKDVSPEAHSFFRAQYLSDAQHVKTRKFFTRIFGATFAIAWFLFLFVSAAFTVTLVRKLFA
jgi:hypothetical protein